MKTLPDYREIEVPIPISALSNYLEPLLYQLGYVHDHEEILKAEGMNIAGDIWVKIKLKKRQEVELIQH